MFIKDLSYQIEFSSYCERHFCKDFLKKYKTRQWLETRKTIIATLERAYAFQNTGLIDNLKFSQEDGVGIFKLDFRVAGTNFSPKTSGNRVIFSLSINAVKIKVLLVYGKDHCDKKHSETQWILEQIKANFPEYRKYC
ncbi:hypothetical protein IPG41_00670 [Candidatus Peregrinibacteria bacterium]|nr:MAG: hypothetical protein IPG41_00670 [Candidatus Peregrinibacteria bacterium]